MGSGIALTALYADHEVTLTDISPEALERAREYIEGHLSRKGFSDRFDRLAISQDLDALSGSDAVIEAALETLELKRELFAQLDRICPAPAILATNTSTLSVTAIAAATSAPERVAGMHFFNPAPVLKLVEIAKGTSTSQETVSSLVESMGKTPVVTSDSPGFIVNRVARPFYGEALRLLAERTASHEEIDVLATLGAGFRMGPFELMDLIGLDVNLAAATTMYKATFGEPRYRPHWLQRKIWSRAVRSVANRVRGFISMTEMKSSGRLLTFLRCAMHPAMYWSQTGAGRQSLADFWARLATR